MTSSQLKQAVESAGHESHFFDRKTLKFFGDTMRNYGVSGPVEVTTPSGDTVKAWELFRRRPVKHGLNASAYFDVDTFRQVHPAR
jgi:hypothetical protein